MGWFIVSSGGDPLEVTLADGQVATGADFGLTYRGVVTTSVDPGAVSIFAGDGTDANVDGVGTAASFRGIAGVIVIGDVAFVGGTTRTARVNDPSNLMGACASCNAAKGARALGEGPGQWWPPAWPSGTWWPFGP